MRILAQRADARTLSQVSVIVAGLEERVRDDEAARDTLAGVARLFADPEVLAPIAAGLLAQQDEGTAAAELIAYARVAGAYALYGARTKALADPRARIAFVTTMKSLGDSAFPVVRAALERIFEQATTGQHRAATELAEDLLLSVPKANDEITGNLVVRFAASPVPTLCRAAARALPRVWGERARPVLLHLVEHEDDGVCVAAIVGLREIDAVDLEAVTRIGAQVDRGRVRTPAAPRGGQPGASCSVRERAGRGRGDPPAAGGTVGTRGAEREQARYVSGIGVSNPEPDPCHEPFAPNRRMASQTSTLPVRSLTSVASADPRDRRSSRSTRPSRSVTTRGIPPASAALCVTMTMVVLRCVFTV